MYFNHKFTTTIIKMSSINFRLHQLHEQSPEPHLIPFPEFTDQVEQSQSPEPHLIPFPEFPDQSPEPHLIPFPEFPRPS